MDYEKLKQEIKEITAIAESVPEAFRQRCFEILLNKALAQGSGGEPKKEDKHKEDLEDDARDDADKKKRLTLPGQVKAFMRRRDISDEQMAALFMLEDGEFHWIKEPSHSEVRRGQSEWALLLALKNGVLNNALKADPEDVRSIVQDKGYYSQNNFASNFKTDKYATYFKEPLTPQGPAQPLSQEGEKALGDLITSLTAE